MAKLTLLTGHVTLEAFRKGAGADERSGLENRRGFTPAVGSNPTPSARAKRLPRGGRCCVFLAGWIITHTRTWSKLVLGPVRRSCAPYPGELLFHLG